MMLHTRMKKEKGMTQRSMKAVLLHGYGDVNRLLYEDAPMPAPAAGEVLVKTIAVSINPIDWKLRRGDLREMMPLECIRQRNPPCWRLRDHAEV
jgi:NADPH-dependent curcumin reductase CurA